MVRDSCFIHIIKDMIALTQSQEDLLLDHFGAPLKLNNAVPIAIMLDARHLCHLGLLCIESVARVESVALAVRAQEFVVSSCHQFPLYSGDGASEQISTITLNDKIALLATLTPDGILEMIERKPSIIAQRWYHRCDSIFQSLIDKCCDIHALPLDHLPKYLTHDNDVYRKAATFRFFNLEDIG